MSADSVSPEVTSPLLAIAVAIAEPLFAGPPHSDDMQRKSRIFAQNLSSTYSAGSPKNGTASQNHLDLFRHLKKREGRLV